MTELASKGYFTCADGTKSNDEANSHLIKKPKKKVLKVKGSDNDDKPIKVQKKAKAERKSAHLSKPKYA